MSVLDKLKDKITSLNNNISISNESAPKVSIVYASFTSRLMASIIDCFILIVIITPLMSIISYNMLPEFKNLQPADAAVMQERIQAVQDKTLSMTDLMAEMPAVQIMLNPEVLKKVILLNVLQLAAILGLILLCWHFKGNSPGKYITGTVIVDADTLQTPSNKQFILRILGYIIDFIPGLGLGFLWALFNKKHQAWHDKIANTVVIRQRVNLWQALTEWRR